MPAEEHTGGEGIACAGCPDNVVGREFYTAVLVQDAIVAESAEFCDSLAETPGVLDTAGFGWPTESSSVTASIAAMTAYRDRWTALAGVAPTDIADDAAALASIASTIVDNATASQSIDPQGSLDQVSDVANSTGIRAYTNKYCR